MKVIFNFKKSTCRLNWVKILKVVFGFNLKEAKAIVDSGSYVHIVDNLNNPIVEVSGFPDFVRKDNDGKIITETKERDGKQVKVASIYNSVFIYTLCTDEGECIKSDASLIKRGENLFTNSKRIITCVIYSY